MKKVTVAAIALGLLIAPTLVFARNGVDDTPPSSQTDNNQQAVVDTPQGNIKVETEAQLPADSIELSEATAIAQEVFPNKTISKVEIESEHGATVYSTRFSDDSRVDVRATDGEVVRSEDKGSD